MPQAPIQSIVILGGGTAGWMAAATLVRAFGGRMRITLIESEQIGTVGVGEATIPQIRLINQYLGLDENEFLAATQGSFKLGIQFEGWTRPGHRYIHAFGEIGRALDIVPFHHYWLRDRTRGGPNLWDWSLNAEAAARNVFARLEPGQSEVASGINYAFHFDASLYAAFLRRHAEVAGVRRAEGRVEDIQLDHETGHVRRLRLEDGREIHGDLFIDCSGFRSLLLGHALKNEYVDWSHWLPCDRAMALPTARTSLLAPYTRAIARKAGWQWRIPLQHRTGNGLVYCSRYMDDDQAASLLLDKVEGEVLGDPRPLRFTTGHRARFWDRNCIALGLAAGFMEPLESTSIHLIQSGISRLLTLFPDAAFAPSLIDEYNRQTRLEFECIRDFLILHYHANGRVAEPFWEERLMTRVPDSLARRMQLFRASGRIVREADELFTEQSWLQVLLGQGIEPTAWHPAADRLSDADLTTFLGQTRKAVKRVAARLPHHAEFLRQNCPAQSPES